MPIIGQISVGDGATFTPSVDNAGVLSWTNNKNLTNPATVDLAQAVLDKGLLAPIASPAFTGTPTAPTPTAGDDSTKIATTEFVQDAIDAEETRADGAYLPLSGGTMTGAISRNGIAVKCTSDAGLTEFLGGTDTTSSYIVLYGKNQSSNPGVINMRAYDGTNSSYLKLTPTGDLTWGEKDVERVHAYSISASTGYVRYASGLQMVWGSIDRVGTTAVDETYAVAFSAYPSVVATANSNATIYINANNSTRFTVRTASGTTTVRYIAIGKWQ